MTKQEYIDALTKALKIKKVKEIDEIISEYEDHFAFKITDGYSEEEVAAKLEKTRNHCSAVCLRRRRICKPRANAGAAV